MTAAFHQWGHPISRQLIAPAGPSRLDNIAIDAFWGAPVVSSGAVRYRAILFLSLLLCLGLSDSAWGWFSVVMGWGHA